MLVSAIEKKAEKANRTTRAVTCIHKGMTSTYDNESCMFKRITMPALSKRLPAMWNRRQPSNDAQIMQNLHLNDLPSDARAKFRTILPRLHSNRSIAHDDWRAEDHSANVARAEL